MKWFVSDWDIQIGVWGGKKGKVTSDKGIGLWGIFVGYKTILSHNVSIITSCGEIKSILRRVWL